MKEALGTFSFLSTMCSPSHSLLKYDDHVPTSGAISQEPPRVWRSEYTLNLGNTPQTQSETGRACTRSRCAYCWSRAPKGKGGKFRRELQRCILRMGERGRVMGLNHPDTHSTGKGELPLFCRGTVQIVSTFENEKKNKTSNNYMSKLFAANLLYVVETKCSRSRQ